VPENVEEVRVRLAEVRAHPERDLPEDVEQVRVRLAEVRFDPAKDLPGEGHTKYLAVPDMQTVLKPPAGTNGGWLKIDRLLHKAGLTASVAEGARKLKEKAVKVENQPVPNQVISIVMPVPGELILTLGRKIRRVRVEP
jgi:hypothetical protein